MGGEDRPVERRQRGAIGRMAVDDRADVGPRAHDVEMEAPFGRRLQRPRPGAVFAVERHQRHHLRPQQVVGDRALGVISIASPRRAEMLPAVPGLKPAALIARHWATIAARKILLFGPQSVPSFAAHARWRPAARPLYSRRRTRKRPRLARAAGPSAPAAADSSTPTPKRAPMSANLFDLLLERAPRRDKLAIDAPDGLSLTYAELFARAGRAARALVDRGVEPGDRVAAADRQVARRDRAGARLLQGGGGAAAAQPRLYARRARVFSRRCRAGADDLPPGSARRRARARRQARPQGGREPGRRGATGRFAEQIAASAAELPTVARGRRRSRRHPLHLGHHRALEGRDADPRATSLPTRWRSSICGASPPTTC